MPLARDPDTLRVPAFMRKRNLRARLSRPLVLTALDRKKAGITITKKAKISKQKTRRKRKVLQKRAETFSAPMLDFYAESSTEPAAPKKRLLRGVYTKRSECARNDKTIGQITNYYEKIRVGVIKLSGALSVGDCISYETEEGRYEQIVESMEINRQPVFKAGRGKEIGLKLRKKPLIGGNVYVQKPILR